MYSFFQNCKLDWQQSSLDAKSTLSQNDGVTCNNMSVKNNAVKNVAAQWKLLMLNGCSLHFTLRGLPDCCPVCGSHVRSSPDLLPLASCLPSGDHAIYSTQFLCPK